MQGWDRAEQGAELRHTGLHPSPLTVMGSVSQTSDWSPPQVSPEGLLLPGLDASPRKVQNSGFPAHVEPNICMFATALESQTMIVTAITTPGGALGALRVVCAGSDLRRIHVKARG